MQRVVDKLIESGKTIATMESCTGGGVANAITNIEGVSAAIKFSAVTYSNEFKIKMGVSEEVIEEYSVYSLETAHEMSRNIAEFAGSDYGIGITGKLNRVDKNNLYGDNSTVYISVYDVENNRYYSEEVKAVRETRKDNKELVIEAVINLLLEIL
jgi:PncC family amidohydrolase